MELSPLDKNVVIFLGSEGVNWLTEDCGNTIKPFGINRNFREF